jgi:hypothetical protein
MPEIQAHPAKLWTLQRAAAWIEARGDAQPQPAIPRPIASATLQNLHDALKAGLVEASGCVDGGERRVISSAEWNDYRLTLEHVLFAGYHHYPGSPGVPVIKVLSIRSFPAGALKYQAYKSEARVPSAQSPDGEPGYHRVIDDVLLRSEQVQQQWPPTGGMVGSPHDSPKQTRDRPARRQPGRERALLAIRELYPDGVPDQTALPNSMLCRRVGDKLREDGLPNLSNDTILRAAGRRR